MARIAESLGFTTMSLYRYVSSKDELVMLMQDAATEVIGEVEVSTDDWRQGLRDIAALHLRLYARHPWFLDVPLSLEAVLMPNNIRVADATYRAMRTLPADDALKQAVLLSLSMYVRAFGLLHRDLQATDITDISPATIDLLGQVVTPERFPDLAPVFRSGGYAGDDPGTGKATDDFGIGLEASSAGSKRGSQPLADPRAGTHVRHPGIVREDGCRSRVADDVGPRSPSAPARADDRIHDTTHADHRRTLVSDAQITIPADLLPADGRFGSGPSQGPPGPGRGPDHDRPHGAGHLAPPGAGARPRRRRSVRACTTSSPCPTVTRSCSATVEPPRSGTSPPSAWCATGPSTSPSVSSRASSRTVTKNAPFLGDSTIIKGEPGTPPRRRAPRPASTSTPGRTTRPRTGVMAPVHAGRRRRRRRPRAHRRHLGRRRPAGRRHPDRRLLLRAAEVVRLRRWPLAGRCSPPPPSRGSRRSRHPAAGSPTSSACRPRSATPA